MGGWVEGGTRMEGTMLPDVAYYVHKGRWVLLNAISTHRVILNGLYLMETLKMSVLMLFDNVINIIYERYLNLDLA